MMMERENLMATEDVVLDEGETIPTQESVVSFTQQAEKAKAHFVKDMMNMTDYNQAKMLVKDEEDIVEDPRS